MNAMLKKAKVLLAQPVPRFLYMAVANRGNLYLAYVSSYFEQKARLVSRPQRSRNGHLPCAKTTPHEIVTGQHARSILWISIAQVAEHSLKQEKYADAEERGSDDRHNPMNARPR